MLAFVSMACLGLESTPSAPIGYDTYDVVRTSTNPFYVDRKMCRLPKVAEWGRIFWQSPMGLLQRKVSSRKQHVLVTVMRSSIKARAYPVTSMAESLNMLRGSGR